MKGTAAGKMTYDDFCETIVTDVEGNSTNDVDGPTSSAFIKGLYGLAKVVTLDELEAIFSSLANSLDTRS